jgi:pyruvate/2-oxoacid:ferredoxin oxidoreductase beta subunit
MRFPGIPVAATGFAHGRDGLAIVAATGCNTVYCSTYPYNPFLVPWTSSLFENAPAVAMGVRAKWDQRGWRDKRLWVVGGDGAMYDIGFQSLSRLLASGMDVKVLVLDTQVYSNTGGQVSTASFLAQDAKMAAVGAAVPGKVERRKELGLLALAHGEVCVAQTTAAHVNHFYRAILDANTYPGPAVVVAYTTCQPEHGVGDDLSAAQARLAVASRAFPLFTYDPRRGPTLRERLSLQGNPDPRADWHRRPKSDEVVDFIAFARTERRFARQFAPDGTPSPALLATRADRLANWRRLQELAGAPAGREPAVTPWASPAEEVAIMFPFWPLLVVLAVGVVIVLAIASGRRLFPGSTTIRESFWCRFRRQPVEVDFEETVWDGRRLDVTRCSAFEPPTHVTCDKACLRDPVLPAVATQRDEGR